MNRRTLLAVVAAGTIVAAGCTATSHTGDTNDSKPPEMTEFTSRFELFDSCTELETYLSAAAHTHMTPWGIGNIWRDVAFPMPEIVDAAVDAAAPATRTAADHSTTNTHTDGVGEADLVVTDGTYMYTAVGGNITVIDVAGATPVADIDVGAGSHQLLLIDDRLVITTAGGGGGGAETNVTVVDVSDPHTPEQLGVHHFEGSVRAVRSHGSIVRIVAEASIGDRFDFVNPNMFGFDDERARIHNIELVANATADDWLPRTYHTDRDGHRNDITTAVDCDNVGAPANFSGFGVTWVIGVDTTTGNTVTTSGVVANGGTVYASEDHLYVTTSPAVVTTRNSTRHDERTAIHAFSLHTDNDTWLGSADVDGRLLNQFAMHEHNGVLRVATTINAHDFGEYSESAVHTFNVEDGTLTELGYVDGLGIDERIYAVRFLGDVGYVVTFREIDPLYVIDLSDPTNPTVEGELKIPGYSSYLHPVGDGLLVGVGQDADLDGRTLGTQLSLFDVSDPTDPRRVDTVDIGGHTSAEHDHHAFLWWAADGTIAIPVSASWHQCDDCLTAELGRDQHGVAVARLHGTSLDGVGVIAHTNDNYCWDPVRRSVVVGDELITVGTTHIVFTDRATLAQRAKIELVDSCRYDHHRVVEPDVGAVEGREPVEVDPHSGRDGHMGSDATPGGNHSGDIGR